MTVRTRWLFIMTQHQHRKKIYYYWYILIVPPRSSHWRNESSYLALLFSPSIAKKLTNRIQNGRTYRHSFPRLSRKSTKRCCWLRTRAFVDSALARTSKFVTPLLYHLNRNFHLSLSLSLSMMLLPSILAPIKYFVVGASVCGWMNGWISES